MNAPWVGQRIKRREDQRFLTGRGQYIDDRVFPDVVHVFPVRSPHAHARVLRIDTAAAAALPGVVAVYTAADFAGEIAPSPSPVPKPYRAIEAYPFARDVARFVGETVALVVADNPYIAEDAAQLVEVEYEPLAAVVDPEAACAPDSPRVHANVPSNIAWRRRFRYGDIDAAMAGADRIVRRRLHLHRFTSAPIETRQAVITYQEEGGVFHVFSNIGTPERYRGRMAASLGIDQKKIHFECPDIGGSFGMKESTQWVILLSAVARRLRRPVKWVEDRTGHLIANHHSNEVLFDAAIAVKNDGTILGLSATAIHDEGAYLGREPKGAVNQLRGATALYNFRHFEIEFLAVMTNKSQVGANRSYGKVQQTMLVERMIDEAAREIGVDPIAMRKRNLVRPEEMPYVTPTGAIHDGGDYPEAFRRLEAVFDLDAFRARQKEARASGTYLGWGIAAGVEASPSSAAMQHLITPEDRAHGDSEAALARIERNGGVTVALGSVPQGQGHETVVAQIVADELGVTPDDVAVTIGYDSWRDPAVLYSGTHASRFATMGVGAVVGAARALRARLTRLGAHLCNASPADVTVVDGAVVDAVSGTRFSFAELARIAAEQPARLPGDFVGGLEDRHVYEAPLPLPDETGRGNFSLTYAYALSLVIVAIDGATGRIKLERILCIEDCGKRLNPTIVEGMAHGAIAHQIGAALFERIDYDATGQITTATFKDYLTPTAADLPSFEIQHFETPSLFSTLGARGVGEGAGTPLVAAINAVADALSPFGAVLVEGHVTPGDVRDFIRRGRKATA